MTSVDRQVAEVLSMVSAFKRVVSTGDVDGALFYLNAATEKLQKLERELKPDDQG